MTKTVAITGATGTLGRAAVRQFIDDRTVFGNVDFWHIYGCARNLESAHVKDHPYHFESVDVTDPVQICRFFQSIGKVDALVTCAGVSLVKPTVELTPNEWRKVIDVNLTGTLLSIIHALLVGVKRIVTIGSIHGCTPTSYPKRAAYTASKAGVMGLTQALAVELAPQGVSVNCVAPGHLPALMPGTSSGQELLDAARDKTPLGRLVTPEEVAEVIFWLCDSAPVSLTGQTIVIDGGFTQNTFPF